MSTKSDARSKGRDQKADGFYEMMPNAYTDNYELFPARDENLGSDEELSEDAVRQKMVRQLLMLVGLLLIQFVLFAILIQSTINLT